jgi:hypothetical protein
MLSLGDDLQGGCQANLKSPRKRLCGNSFFSKELDSGEGLRKPWNEVKQVNTYSMIGQTFSIPLGLSFLFNNCPTSQSSSLEIRGISKSDIANRVDGMSLRGNSIYYCSVRH